MGIRTALILSGGHTKFGFEKKGISLEYVEFICKTYNSNFSKLHIYIIKQKLFPPSENHFEAFSEEFTMQQHRSFN